VSTLQKIILACFLGGFTGTIVALQLGFFWWLGMVVGSFVGYLSYEFKTVITACKRTWKTVVRWEPIKLRLKAGFWLFLGIFNFLLTLILPILALNFSPPYLLQFILALIILSGFFVLVGLIGESKEETIMYGESGKSFIKKMNFIRFYFLLLPKGLYWVLVKAIPFIVIGLLVRIPRFVFKIIIPNIWKFAKHVFLEIHSDARLLCGIDSAIGVFIGFIAGNAIIGGISGVAFGGLNYEIVSKRILHLSPNEN
jgi:hypothetical protein